MVVALTNKVWLNNGGGGGNGYHSNWLGPDSLGRTVATLGVDQAHLLQSQSGRESCSLLSISTVLYSTVQYSTVQYSTIQYRIVLWNIFLDYF